MVGVASTFHVSIQLALGDELATRIALMNALKWLRVVFGVGSGFSGKTMFR